MTERQIELIGLYFDGKAAPSDAAELLAALKSDETFLDAFMAEWEMHWLLKSSDRSERDQELARKRIVHYVRAQNDTVDFLEGVKARIERPATRKPKVVLSLRRYRWQAAMILLGLGAAVYLYVGRAAPVNSPAAEAVLRVAEARSGVKVVREGREQKLQEGASILSSDRVVSEQDKVVLQQPDGTTYEMNRDSELLLDGRSPNVVRGDVLVSAAPTPNAPLIIHSTAADVTVVGTRFEVSVDSDETTVRVAEGTVRFGKGGAGIAVGAKQASHAVLNQTPLPASPIALSDVAPWRSANVSGRNLIANGGFDDDFTGWTVEYLKKGGLPRVFHRSESPPGKNSAVFSDDSTVAISQNLPCRPGQKFKVDASCGHRLGEISLSVTFLNEKSEALQTVEIDRSTTPRPDVVLSGTVTAPAGTARLRYKVTSMKAASHLDQCSVVLDR